MQNVKIDQFTIGEEHPLLFFSGPCVIESEEHTLKCAERLCQIFEGKPLVFKASFDKANRSSIKSFRGPGMKKGLEILAKIKQTFGLPLVTDIHLPEQAGPVSEVCDVIQIPAFLCRQTDLLVAAAQTGRVVKVKKGQFLAPWDMQNVVDKLVESGAKDILLTERGTGFGYNNLVCDMRSIPIMKKMGYPVCFDASHAVQLPGGQGTQSGGQTEFIPPLAKAAIAAGANCLFIESHDNPSSAKSDAGSVMAFDALEKLVEDVC